MFGGCIAQITIHPLVGIGMSVREGVPPGYSLVSPST